MKTISLINMKGGVGKTTLAVNIADYLYTRLNKSVLLVDIDPQFNATQCLMEGPEYIDHIQKGNDTIVNIFDRSFRASVAVVDGTVQNEPKKLVDIGTYKTQRGFDLLPGALDLYKLEMAPGDGREFRLKKFLSENNHYDYVIIDTPPTPSVWMTSALLASDYFLIPVKPDPISLTGIDLLNGIISEKTENFGLSIECAGVIFTMTEVHTNVFKDAVKYIQNSPSWKTKLYKKDIPKRTEVARSQLNQEFILDSTDSRLKLDFSGIMNEFIERIEG